MALYSGHQRGKGLGSFFAGLFRAAMPLLRSAGKEVGKQALVSGIDFVRDLSNRTPPKEALKRRLGEAGDSLTEKFKSKVSRMSGSGLKGGGKKRARSGARKTGKTTKRKTVRGRGRGGQRKTKGRKKKSAQTRRRPKQQSGGRRKKRARQQPSAAVARLIKQALINKSAAGGTRKKKRAARQQPSHYHPRSASDIFG
jgi:hypothetical protein